MRTTLCVTVLGSKALKYFMRQLDGYSCFAFAQLKMSGGIGFISTAYLL